MSGVSDFEATDRDVGLSRKQKLLRDQREKDLLNALDHAPSRRLLLRLVEDVGYFRTTFTGAGPEYTAFNEGVRSVGVKLVGEIEAASPGSFAKMQSEAIALAQRQGTKEE